MNPFVPQTVAEGFSVSPQLEPAAMADVAAAGFRSVINARPDGEGGSEQPTHASVEQAAHEAGLAYAHLPVEPQFQTPEQIAAFAQLLEALPKPIVAFCRSGARATRLYKAATGG